MIDSNINLELMVIIIQNTKLCIINFLNVKIGRDYAVRKKTVVSSRLNFILIFNHWLT